MKFFISLFLCSAIIFCGFSSTHQLLYCSMIEDETKGKNAVIKLKNGEEVEGKIIEISIDSTFNEILLPKEERIIPTSQVIKIKTKDHLQGAFDGIGKGFIYGLLVGLGGGGIYALTSADFGDRMTIGSLIVLPFVGGVIGSIVGIPFGGVIGHEDNYLFNSSLPNEYIRIKSISVKK